MSKLIHVDGVNDEVLDVALVGGLLYMAWRLSQHAVAGPQGPEGPPGPVGPPATVIPPPDGGHLDPTAPPLPAPTPPRPVQPAGLHAVPAPLAQRDWYTGGPATSPPLPPAAPIIQGPSPASAPKLITGYVPAIGTAPYGPPPVHNTIQAGPLAGVKRQGPSPAAHPKIIVGHVPATPPPNPAQANPHGRERS